MFGMQQILMVQVASPEETVAGAGQTASAGQTLFAVATALSVMDRQLLRGAVSVTVTVQLSPGSSGAQA